MDPIRASMCVCSCMGVEDREGVLAQLQAASDPPKLPVDCFWRGATLGSMPALPTHPLPDEDVSPCKSAFSCQD